MPSVKLVTVIIMEVELIVKAEQDQLGEQTRNCELLHTCTIRGKYGYKPNTYVHTCCMWTC